eukprot:gene3740-13798_t
MQPAAVYSVIESGVCEDSELYSIFDYDECREAWEATGYSITSGPSQGYKDVVDGCSIRPEGDFYRNDKGTCEVGAFAPSDIPGVMMCGVFPARGG